MLLLQVSLQGDVLDGDQDLLHFRTLGDRVPLQLDESLAMTRIPNADCVRWI